ncbi:PREDICTED: uncharacterized protein LOC101816049 [Ficedula albicollis]|uniref:uncharacterized protein LOC101816049 n=1 Tax=Ficedula albicollis TaxID=59894 RepID=UPI000359E155|nr:PREDICTED: uncharacterized protein LOC101816049 [Ficedula albicollis]
MLGGTMWSSLTWFGLHVVTAISLAFATFYLNMGPITKGTVAVIQFILWVDMVWNSCIFNFLWKADAWIQSYHTLTVCFWGYFNNGTFCEEMTAGEIFSQPFTQFFRSIPPVFKGFIVSLNANYIIQWLGLLCLFYLALRDNGRLTWITTLISTPGNRDTAAETDPVPETRDAAPEPDPAPGNRDAAPQPDPALETRDAAPQPDPTPQPTSEMNHPDWVGVSVREIREIGQMLKEYLSPASEKPSPCLKEGESDGAAVEPTNVTTVQVPAEPQGLSQPAGEPEVITEYPWYESLRNLRKDIARRGCEATTTWLLRVLDLVGTSVQLDATEARNLGPLTQDSGLNQVFVREPGPLSLWERLLMSVRERFVYRERMPEHHRRRPWKTLEEGIQQLREVAVLEVLFGRDGQHDNDPDKVRCTGQMLWNLATLGPSQYTAFIAMINADNKETVGSVTSQLRNFESMMEAYVSAVVKELEQLKEKIREMREEIRRNISHMARMQVTGPKVRAQSPPSRERGYTPRADLWFFLRDHGEDMRRWDGKPTYVLAARVRQLREGSTNQGSSAKVKIASTSHDQGVGYYRREDNLSDPLEGPCSMYAQEGNNN